MTLQFIAALLRAKRSEQERFYAQQVPLGFFATQQAQMRWVYDFRERNNVYPSRMSFAARFPAVTLPITRDPLRVLVETIIHVNVFQQMGQVVDHCRELHEGGRSVPDVLESFRRGVYDIRTYDMTFSDVACDPKRALKAYRDFVRRRALGLIKPPSFWPEFNRMVPVMMPGEYTVLAARTSIGKSWVMIAWANYLMSTGERVLIISKEMPSTQIMMRAVALQQKLDYPRLRSGNLRPNQLARWARHTMMLKKVESNMLISGHEEATKGVGFSHIIQKVQEFKPTVLIVDGAYLIYPEEKFPSDQQRFAFVSATLHRIGLAYRLKTFAVVQAKRDAEADTASGVTTARLRDIYGADNWAQDADYVLILNGQRGSSVRTLAVEKGREGETGEFSINFQLSPYPHFSQVNGALPSAQNKIQFEGI